MARMSNLWGTAPSTTANLMQATFFFLSFSSLHP